MHTKNFYYEYYNSPIGLLTITATKDNITGLCFRKENYSDIQNTNDIIIELSEDELKQSM